MPHKFKSIKGNYCQVTDALNFPPVFYAPQSSAAYEGQIKLDLNRTVYVNFAGTAEELKSQLLTSRPDGEASLSFTQGSFDGGVFTNNILSLHEKFADILPRASLNGEKENVWDSLRMAYIDDAGQLCAFSLAYLRNDPDPAKGEAAVPLDKRKRWFVASVIKNVTHSPSKREVTFVSHIDLLSEDVKASTTEVDERSVPELISTALNSKKLSELLSGLIVEDSISLERFLDIQQRLCASRNIDNRDLKQQELAEKMASYTRLWPDNEALINYFRQLQKRSTEELDFFKEENFKATLGQIDEQVRIVFVGEYNKYLKAFRARLDDLATRPMKPNIKKLHTQGTKIIDEIEKIAKPKALQFMELLQLCQVLNYSAIAMAAPQNQENLKKLVELSKHVSGKASPMWKSLGAGILVFTGLVLVAAGVLGALPTGGMSLLLAVSGGLLLAGTGVGCIRKGSEQGLAKLVTGFKAQAENIESSDMPELGPTL